MNWFLFSVLSIFFLAISEIIQQYLLNLKDAFSPRVSATLTFLVQSFIALLLLFVFNIEDQIFLIFDFSIFLKLLLVSFLSSISMILYLKSFKVRSISFSLIFVSFSVVISTLLGIIFFSESVNFLKFLGIAFIMLAIILVNYKNASLEKNSFYGLLAGFIFGFNYFLDKSIILEIHPLIYIFWNFFMIVVWGFIFNIKDFINSIKFKRISDYKFILFSGIGYFLFNLFTFMAYSHGGEVGRVDAINNSQIFLIIFFEFLILRQRDNIKSKIVISLLAVIGVCILGFVK